MKEKWNKVERLAIAGIIAPILRNQDENTSNRRVTKIDKNGNVVGYTTLSEVQRALLLTKQLEIEVVENSKSKEILCVGCGRVVKNKKTNQKYCDKCVTRKCGQCGKTLKIYSESDKCSDCHLNNRRIIKICVDCGTQVTGKLANSSYISKKISPKPRCVMCQKEWRRKYAQEKRVNCIDCGKQLCKSYMCPSSVKARNGNPPTCRKCMYKYRTNTRVITNGT